MKSEFVVSSDGLTVVNLQHVAAVKAVLTQYETLKNEGRNNIVLEEYAIVVHLYCGKEIEFDRGDKEKTKDIIKNFY